MQVVGDANGWDCRPDGLEFGKFACAHVGALGVAIAVHGTGVRNVRGHPGRIAAQATNNVTVADARNETNTLNNGATDTADVDPSADLRLPSRTRELHARSARDVHPERDERRPRAP